MDNPSANDATGPGFVAAGENFTLVLEVRDAEGSRTPNFGNEQSGEALEIVASALVVPLTGRNGAADDGVIANGSTFVAVAPAGTFRASTLSYDEYGIIRLQASIADDDYLGTGEITGTESANVGRFYPAEFTLASGAVTGACSGFTYMDQAAISVSFDLEARGAAGNVLFNYDLARLGSTGVAVPQFHAENDNQGIDLIGRTSLTPSSWNDGHFVLSSSTEGFSRLSTPDGPFDTLQLGLSINDMLDGIAITSPDMNPDTSTDCAVLGNCDAKKLGGPTGIRYGRLEVMNSFGPETEPLDIKMKANYFDDNGNFTTNTSDSCTGYINSGVTLSNYQGGLPSLTVPSPASVNLLTNGLALPGATVVLSAPGVHNDGSVEVSYDAPSWLEYDWNGSGNEDPKGTASFGHFRGHDRVIYWREVLD